MAPDASLERLRVITDWGNWIFPFDDLFDSGELRRDKGRASALMERILRPTEDDYDGDHGETDGLEDFNRWIQFHDMVWQKLQEESPAHCTHYAQAMHDYAAWTLEQVEHAASGHVISPGDLAKARRGSICVKTLFALAAFGQNIVIPSAVQDHDSIKRLEALSIDIVVIHNDLVSYTKEKNEGVEHNGIINLQKSGMPFQDACNGLLRKAQDLTNELFFVFKNENRLTKNEQQHAEFLSRNPEFRDYVELLRLVPQVNLHWSFMCERFRPEGCS
ncbi:hypothetical protein LTR17_018555 [Elasticomyces elasticus]|nr:hypothetical protein LTR17_018555 [Elasticomyces elasticus]